MDIVTKQILNLNDIALNTCMLCSSSIADEILGYLLDEDVNWIEGITLEEMNDVIETQDFVLIEKSYNYDGKEEYCIQGMYSNIKLDTTYVIIDKNIEDLVNYKNLYADEIFVIDEDTECKYL